MHRAGDQYGKCGGLQLPSFGLPPNSQGTAYGERDRCGQPSKSRQSQAKPKVEHEIVGVRRVTFWPTGRFDVPPLILIQELVESDARSDDRGSSRCSMTRSAPCSS